MSLAALDSAPRRSAAGVRPSRNGIGLVIALSLSACSDSGPTPSPVDAGDENGGHHAPPDAGTKGDAGTGADAGALDASELGPVDAGHDDLGVPDGGATVVRFVALGDTGEGNAAQYEVSRAIETVCLVQGCDFALLLGDNFYDDGVRSADDPQFRTKFEEPYANLQMPFWVTLGNHDFGELPLQFWRTDFQIEYSMRSAKWNLPDHFYSFVDRHVTFISLDTNMIMLGLEWVRDQRGWIREQLAAADTPWVVAFGHHPWRSNGTHGNAGNYEGLGSLDVTGLVSGRRLESFFSEELCSRVDLYLSGHDHNRQWLESPGGCEAELIVSGAGAKLSEFERRDGNPTIFEDDAWEGFFWFELTETRLSVEGWRRDGSLDFRRTIQR